MLPWPLEQELSGPFPGLPEGYRRPDHTASGTNQDFFLCFPIILKSEDLSPIAGRKSSQEGAGWAG